MSRIDDLVAKHCPTGVPFKRLGQLARIASDRVDGSKLGPTTYVGVDNLLPNFAGRRDAGYGSNSSGAIRFGPGDVLIGNIRPYLRKVWHADRDGGASPDVLTVALLPGSDELLMSRFLYYVLASDAFIDYQTRHAKGGKMPRGDKSATLAYPVPLPPLEIQAAVTQTLDAMTGLQIELELELALRSRQQRFYRERLMSFERVDDVRWMPMGEVGEFVRGKRFTKLDYVDDGIPCIHYGEIYTVFGATTETVVSRVRSDLRSSLRFARTGDVILTGVSETVEDICKAVAWLGPEDVAVHDDCFAFRHDMDPKFVSYYLQTESFHAEKAKHVARAKVKRISAESLAKLSIPVPPRDEQERIVAILDKFDALVNDMSIGLPAEIAARRKQYEYYRDKLLTFPEKDAS